MPNDLQPGAQAYPLHLDKWDIDVMAVKTENKLVYFTIRSICLALNIDFSGQYSKLVEDDDYAGSLEEFHVPTLGGYQKTWCIRQKECAWWIAHINPKKVRPDLKTRLEEFKADLMAEADRLIFGDLTSLVTIKKDKPTRGTLYFGCPRCGADLCFVGDEDGIHLKVASM